MWRAGCFIRTQRLRLQFQANEEQHHHNAKFRDMLDRDDADPKHAEQRRNHNPRDQVAKHRAKAQAAGNWHRDDTGDQEDKGEKEGVGHG